MTDKPPSPPTQSAVPSQTLPSVPQGPTIKDYVAQKVETVEEEPYTIKCICNFSDDDGNTIYCETCDTWQHIDCFYPNNRDEAIREDFAHSCAECKPRPLDRQKAIERTLRLRNAATEAEPLDRRTKRQPPKGHKRKPKPTDQVNGHSPQEGGKPGNPSDHPHPPKKAKSSHRPSQSISSQAPKRSPSNGTAKGHAGHPPSPATTPPDLPDDFQIHHYSESFCSLYSENEVPEVHSNAFASLAIPTALSRWLREPNTMKQEVGRTHSEVFQPEPPNLESNKPKLEVHDVSRSVHDNVVRWRSLRASTPIEKDLPLIELNGAIGFQKDYCADLENLWADISSPLPFVFFHPVLPLYIDTRKEGSLARYVRRSCKPNAQLDTYLSDGSDYQFWIVSDRHINAHEPITLPWEFRLEKSVGPRWLHLLGLSDEDSPLQNEPEMDKTEYTAISTWIDRILSEYGGCACDLENNCAFARFHRQYLWSQSHGRSANKKKQRKPKTQAISPSSTGQATNSRATSEGNADDGADHDARSQSGSKSKPPSRDLTPLRQGSFDQLGILTELTDREKRKVAMVEDTFRRLEQQQPPRKKKRTSDGTNGSISSKPKSRNGSTVSHGNYVDAGAGRSKSGSPASTRSPQLGHSASNAQQEKQDPPANRSRQSSINSRPVYCDAGVQTDPVEGEWFSEPPKSPRPKKRIISLSQRLLNSRFKVRSDEQEQQRKRSISQLSPGSCTSASPVMEHKQLNPVIDAGLRSPVSQNDEISMVDAPPTFTHSSPTDVDSSNPPKIKTPDLRVQLPPVPAFDNTGLAHHASTPLSATGSISQSPLSCNISSPFVPSMNGIVVHPSPVKKKLSLSDYTKSRMNKAAGKVSGGTAILKPSISSPEDTKVDIVIEENSLEKGGESVAPGAVPTQNGHS